MYFFACRVFPLSALGKSRFVLELLPFFFFFFFFFFKRVEISKKATVDNRDRKQTSNYLWLGVELTADEQIG